MSCLSLKTIRITPVNIKSSSGSPVAANTIKSVK